MRLNEYADSLRALRRSLGLCWRAAPRELVQLTLLSAGMGAGPAFTLFLGKVVIDQTARIAESRSESGTLHHVLANPVLLWAVVGFLVAHVVLDTVETIQGFQVGAFRDKLEGSTTYLMYDKVAGFEDIALFEDPERLNILQLAEQSIPRIHQLATTVSNLMIGVFVLVPVVGLSFSLAWWVPIVIFATAMPSVLVQLGFERRAWNVEETLAGTTRSMRIRGQVLTSPEYAKEIRLFRLQPLLLAGWRTLFHDTFDHMQRVRRQGAVRVLAWSLVSGPGVGIPYAFVVLLAASGQFSLGDLALYAGIVFEVRRSLFILAGNGSSLHEIALASRAAFRLLDLEPTLVSRTPALPTSAVVSDAGKGLVVGGVTFAYPGSERPVLQQVDLEVRPGEMLVVVGENGAGKTTLAKLLCRLYDPQEGTITWNGHGIRSVDLNEWRDRIGVVNQDYARFPATMRENIGYGQLSGLDDDERVRAAAGKAGLLPAVAKLPRDLDTTLSKQLDHGIEPSGGQWQRIAIARALMRDDATEILIFDEPTAALDALAEHDILGILRSMAKGKATIVISHRLALARDATQILVMEHGRVIERGTHPELMAKSGVYHDMFTRQASSYVGLDSLPATEGALTDPRRRRLDRSSASLSDESSCPDCRVREREPGV
ncbi:ABC transporter ATP-binding protein [Actinopolymorpha rutila]|uniref:ATP-binding cassette subfamily B protein n=1 Tax=Actinopolymorpha rutila TaxID=446787 RepID=A0A852ZGA6_9ACTN|nr:ABC transporter ATP-binding protein [Actinopolymorpha rutila]NYH88659.1 ATP-binding cassette subfamily B protein [Actinopolymorpha rutila]